MHWPQITMIVLIAASTGVHLARHGQPRSNHNVWWQLGDAAIITGLLYAGGFCQVREHDVQYD